MWGWLSRCWGGIGVKSQFERARIRSVIVDWQVPDDSDICIIVNSFKGENPEIQPQTAFNMFFSHLEMSEEKSNPLYQLKHLYVLDHTIEEGVALQRISSYYSSQFFIFKQGSSIQFNPLREMVATYFLYLKKKAEVYNSFEPKYFAIRKSERIDAVGGLNFTQIFTLIDNCLDIQKGIDDINMKYQNHNKQSALIQMVFTMLLKSYLFCYTLVSVCAKVLFNRLRKLTRAQLSKFYKFIRYYNKEYTRNLYNFVQSNKQIYQFKNMKYSEIILIDKCYIEYLENYIHNLQNQPLAMDGPDFIDFEEEKQVQPLPQDIDPDLLEAMFVTYHYKKHFNIEQSNEQLEAVFYDYQNLYSDLYESAEEVDKRKQYNGKISDNPNTSGIRLTSSKLLTSSKKIELSSRKDFQEEIWKNWQNVYSS